MLARDERRRNVDRVLFRCAYYFRDNNNKSVSTNAKTDEEVQKHFSIIFFVKEKDEDGKEELVMSHFINDSNGLVGSPDAIKRHREKGEIFTKALKTLWRPTVKVDELRISGIKFDIMEYTGEPSQCVRVC